MRLPRSAHSGIVVEDGAEGLAAQAGIGMAAV